MSNITRVFIDAFPWNRWHWSRESIACGCLFIETYCAPASIQECYCKRRVSRRQTHEFRREIEMARECSEINAQFSSAREFLREIINHRRSLAIIRYGTWEPEPRFSFLYSAITFARLEQFAHVIGPQKAVPREGKLGIALIDPERPRRYWLAIASVGGTWSRCETRFNI